MKFLKRIQSLFTRKPVFESASVRLEKLGKWVDLQYKPLLAHIHTQLLENVGSLKELASKIEKDNLALGTAPIYIENITAQAQVSEYRKQYVNAIHTIVQTIRDADEDITSITIMYETIEQQLRAATVALSRSQKRLETVVGKQLNQMIENVNQLQVLVSQATDILEDSRNKNYVQIHKLIMDVEDGLEQTAKLQAHIEKRNTQVKELKIEYAKYVSKISEIEHDSRYKREKSAMRSADTKFRHSFYELDLQSNYAKAEELQERIKALTDEIKRANQKIESFHITAKRSQIVAMIKRSLQIEVELVV